MKALEWELSWIDANPDRYVGYDVALIKQNIARRYFLNWLTRALHNPSKRKSK